MTAAIAEMKKPKEVPAEIQSGRELTSVMIDVNKIVRSETNRVPEVSDAFVDSIRKDGVMSAVLLRPIKATKEHAEAWKPIDAPSIAVGETIYKLVYGERRWIAAKKAGRTHIPAQIRELTDTRALEIQIDENEQREDYSVMDRAVAYTRLRAQYMEDHRGEKGWTEEKCMDLIASTRKNDKIKGRTVQQIIALGKLHTFCQAALRQGEMEASHGYEMCRRSEEEQLELLKWIRQQTQHSQGDVPSVRRLKLEIRNMDIAADEKRRQEKLFKDPQPGTATTKVPTVAEAAAPGVKSILPDFRAAREAAAQTSAPETRTVRAGLAGTREVTTAPKTSSKAQLKAAEQQRKNAQQEEKRKLSADLERQARLVALDAIAKNAKLDRSLIDLVAIDMLKVSDDDVMQFAQRALAWPKPKARTYSWNETEKIAQAHVPKLKPAQLAGLLVAGLLAEDLFVYAGNMRECKRLDAMARKYKVNLDKIREEVKAKAKVKAPAGKKGAKA